MTVLIAVPVARISCRVIIEKTRAWSVVDEAILLAIIRQPMSLDQLSKALGILHQVCVASLSRLMRFRLVEVALAADGSAFQLSDFGRRSVTSGNPLPVFPKRSGKTVNFVIDFATGDFFPAAQARILTPRKLADEVQAGRDVRYVEVRDGGPSFSAEANLSRLTEIAARGWDEQVASIDSRTASVQRDEFIVFTVSDGLVQGVPERAGDRLRLLVSEAAAQPAGTRTVVVSYRGEKAAPIEALPPRPCTIASGDVLVGGQAHRDCLGEMLGRAHRRFILHSTFLDLARFEALIDPIRDACRRGVRFDILWGDNDDDEDNPTRSGLEAPQIADRVRRDPELRGNIRFHLRSTGSHAKIVLLDTEHDGWVAIVGSCNWLSTPFLAVELSVVLRDPHIVADVCRVTQLMAGRRGVADDLANELAITVNDLYREPAGQGPDTVTLVVGASHEALMARAAQQARHRLVVGNDRLGSTARPGALMQGEAAAGRDVAVTVLYSVPAGPIKKRHTRELKAEAAANGVALAAVGKTRLHGKFLLWDRDDLVVTSLNWTSSAVNADAPWNDIGVHISSLGVGDAIYQTLAGIYPEPLTPASVRTAAG